MTREDDNAQGMGDWDATKEARKRWGDEGYAARCSTTDPATLNPKRWREVGIMVNGETKSEGVGRTWEAAFADADRRAGGGKGERES